MAAVLTDAGSELSGFREAMGRLAASVHIATARHDGAHYGMTVTAACSLCITPAAMVVCVNRSARAHAPMIESGALCLNLLGVGEEAVAARFAGATGEAGSSRFDPAFWELDAAAGPALHRALASIDLVIGSVRPFGTHSILACTVTVVRLGEARPALLYANRRYGALQP